MERENAIAATGEVLVDEPVTGCRHPLANAAAAVEPFTRALEAVDRISSDLGTNHEMALECRVEAVKLLVMLFESTHNLAFIERAVAVAQKAVDAIPKTDKRTENGAVHRRQFGLNTLARVLGMRFEAKGTLADLDSAISILESSLPSLREDDSDFVIGRDYLGILLGTRFEHQGDVADLNDAIRCSEAVVAEGLSSHPDWPGRLQNLANRLAARARYTDQIADLDRAIGRAEQGLRDAPNNHADRAKWLGNLGAFFGMRYMMKQPEPDESDLEMATEMTCQAISLARKRGDVPLFGALANTLGNILRDRYELEPHDVKYLNQAADVLEEALGVLGPDPHRTLLYNGLGETLLLRYEHTRATEDAEGAIQAYRKTLDSEVASPSIRINAAVKAAELLGPQERWDETADLLERAVHLLHVLTPRGLQTENKQQLIRHFSGVGAAAAAAALNAGKCAGHALRYLELGRGVVSGFLLDLCTDTSALRQAHPDLADHFLRLSARLAGQYQVERSRGHRQPVLRHALMVGSFHPGKERWRHSVGREMEEVLTKIRSKLGFEDFLLPPTPEKLMSAADPVPIVVVNVSRFRCHAFLVERNQIRAIPLPNLCQDRIVQESRNIQTNSGSLQAMLKWLWGSIVRPALDALGFDRNLALTGTTHGGPEWPRVLWVPVGPLSRLPLHAAGDHSSHDGQTALDRVMSSYASSIKALIAGRASQSLPPSPSAPGRMVLVSMPNTPGQDRLEFTNSEVAMLSDLCPSMHLTAERSRSLTKNDVVQRLPGCCIFHFAGHGITDPINPSRSCLLLKDWERNPLTVADLREEGLRGAATVGAPFLAYLSACSTASIDRLEFTDEAIHLVGACQLAGFRHVVGTLWGVSDPICADLARRFYQLLHDEGATDTAVCRGLHIALRELRDVRNRSDSETVATVNNDTLDRNAKVAGPSRQNLLWVPYVHFGV